jgi:His Kinase A (phospho-acceptor) domain
MSAPRADWRRLSHELRTPLNAILGNVELLLDGSAGPLSAEARACLGEIQTASRALDREVQGLLGRLPSGAPDARPGADTLDALVVVRELLVSERVAAAALPPPGTALMVCCDPVELRALVRAIVDLGGAPVRSPLMVGLERHGDGSWLDFAWRDFDPAHAIPAQLTPIAAMAQPVGAILMLSARGVRLCWPAAALGASGRGSQGAGGRQIER